MDARPDQEEMEQAIKKFLQLLEKQEKGFKDSWQVTRRTNVNFCQKLEHESQTNTTNCAKICTPNFADGPTGDSTGFFPRIRRFFPSGKIPENEGNILYLSGKIL